MCNLEPIYLLHQFRLLISFYFDISLLSYIIIFSEKGYGEIFYNMSKWLINPEVFLNGIFLYKALWLSRVRDIHSIWFLSLTYFFPRMLQCTVSQKIAPQISPTKPIDKTKLSYHGKAECYLAKLWQCLRGEIIQ